ncbi:MAG: carnitine dehydratase [Blastococcus sp.]|nr:carnitine dehydratase [Blastococcus sp.]
MTGPLDGVRVVELGGIGPGPHAGMVLADLGADVVRVDRPEPGVEMIEPERDFVLRNRRSVLADLKSGPGRELVLSLAGRADVLVEGFRPGVAERLGVGPEDCHARNSRLVYGRITGWGQDGPLARTAGHDINYLALTGVLAALARPDAAPFPPLNLVADIGGGSMFLVTGVLAALLHAERTGRGHIVDAAMVDGVTSMMAMYWTLIEQGRWSADAGTNMTDGGSPFYNVYECADGGHMVVGAVEAKFYARVVATLGLDASTLPDQMDREAWPAVRERFAAAFRSRTRDEWAREFASVDACVTPVLSLDEASCHPHIVERGTVTERHGVRQPAPAPRFTGSRRTELNVPRPVGADLADVLKDWDLPWPSTG